MVELADTRDLKSLGSDTIPVRARSAAPKNPFANANGFFYPSRRLGISSTVRRYIINHGDAVVVSHHASACIVLRLDDIHDFVVMICNSFGIDDMHGFAVILQALRIIAV